MRTRSRGPHTACGRCPRRLSRARQPAAAATGPGRRTRGRARVLSEPRCPAISEVLFARTSGTRASRRRPGPCGSGLRQRRRPSRPAGRTTRPWPTRCGPARPAAEGGNASRWPRTGWTVRAVRLRGDRTACGSWTGPSSQWRHHTTLSPLRVTNRALFAMNSLSPRRLATACDTSAQCSATANSVSGPAPLPAGWKTSTLRTPPDGWRSCCVVQANRDSTATSAWVPPPAPTAPRRTNAS